MGQNGVPTGRGEFSRSSSKTGRFRFLDIQLQHSAIFFRRKIKPRRTGHDTLWHRGISRNNTAAL
ncbi:hypothetical protein D0469_19970 [Peribacillus saganii]|uniref:Uncharacterized protein n=1 Tax=Peribacillus saganii TaxID=2303992 RepID=A0A372LBM1_9BACI|nr:hypothetical protein D0469_19970 [Peribacillus saganii]